MIALASDLDGTLFFNELPGNIKPEDLSAVIEFQKKGHLFGVCTGRAFSDIVKNKTIPFDFYIASSGALILDKQQQIIHEELVDYQIIKAIFDQYVDHFDVFVQGNKRLYSYKTGRFPVNTTIITDISVLESKHLYGLSIDAFNEANAKEVVSQINWQYGKYVEAFQNVDSIDVVKKGCSKGNGLKILKEKLQLDTIYAIGDSYNDLPMLDYADIAFTFNSSDLPVKQHADYLVDHIYQAIEKIDQL